jgi:hypothetical protein
VIPQQRAAVVSVTDLPSPALIATCDEAGETKILLGQRQCDVTALLIDKITEIVKISRPEVTRVVVLLGLRSSIEIKDVKDIVDEINGRLVDAI